jgi:hypothetical protein
MNKPWSDLPNATHIDWVLASMKENPKLWEAAAHAVEWSAAWAAVDAAWNAAEGAARSEARDAARNAVWAAYVADAAWNEAPVPVRDSLLALVAYDDCDQYLALGYEKLRVYAILSGKSQALLLLPIAYVREKMNEKTLV